MTGKYWSAKGKQGIYAFAYSFYFEVGPVLSEAAIGNHRPQRRGMTWQDIVITPAMARSSRLAEDVAAARPSSTNRSVEPLLGAPPRPSFSTPTRSFATSWRSGGPWADPPWLTLPAKRSAGTRAAEIECSRRANGHRGRPLADAPIPEGPKRCARRGQPARCCERDADALGFFTGFLAGLLAGLSYVSSRFLRGLERRQGAAPASVGTQVDVQLCDGRLPGERSDAAWPSHRAAVSCIVLTIFFSRSASRETECRR